MSDEKIETPESSNIKSFSYSRSRGVLTVEFAGGSAWEYEQVAEATFEAMKAAESRGSFFANRIKGYHYGRRLP